MGLLATWGQYSSYVDAAGKHRVIWQCHDGHIVMNKFDKVETNSVMERFFDRQESDWGGIEREVYFLDEDEELLRTVIAYIRTHPAITLAQWNTYLNAMDYEKRAIVKAYIHKLALGLALHYGVVLANYTETEILAKTRNWIYTVALNTLKRVCFGYLITL